MRLLVTIFVLSALVILTQGCTDRYEKLSIVYNYHSEEEYIKALEELGRIKAYSRQNQLLYKEASLFEGEIYFELDSLEKAENSFREVLTGTSKAIQFTRIIKKKISSIDPYSKLYYDANMNLARLHNSRRQYHESLSYLQKAEEGSDYFGCGLGKFDEQFRRDSLFVSNYLELGKIDFIFERLRGNIFNLSKDKNYESIDEIANLIKEQYSSDEIARFLNEVLTSIEKRETTVEGVIEEEYFTNWFGYEVRILGLNMYNYLDRHYYDYEIVIDTITEKPFSIPKTEKELIQMVQGKIMESEIYMELRG